MPPLLAELPAPDSAQALGWLVLAAAALAVAINQVREFVRGFRRPEASGTEIVGQPIEVRGAPEYVRREEFSQLSTRVAHMEAKFDEAVQTLSAQGEDRARRLHARMDTILEAVAEVRGELKRIPRGE